MWLGAGVIVLMLFCLLLQLLRREVAATVFLHILLVIGCWWLAVMSIGEDLDSLLAESGKERGSLAEVSGRVISDLVDYGDRGGRSMVRFSLKLSQVNLDGVDHKVDDVVWVTMYGVSRHPPLYGEVWRLKGRLSAMHHLGDRRRRTSYRLVTGLRNAKYDAGATGVLLERGYALRQWAADGLSSGIEGDSDVTGVIKAMILGYRSQLPDDIRDGFRHTGTMHVFAISGLHVGILCSIIVFALSVLGVPRTGWVLFLAPLVGMYTLVTGGRASAIRAGLMAVAYLAAPLLRRRADAVSAFAFAAIAILLWNPAQLTDVGFIYSFAVVAGIVSIVPLFDRWLSPIWKSDEIELPEMAAREWWWRSGLRMLAGLVAVSFAAWLTSTPLSLYFFGRFSPIALLGNLLAVPLAFLILLTGCLSLISGVFIGILGVIFNSANLVFVRVLIGGMRILEQVPYGWVDCGRIPLWGVFVWYGVLIVVVALLYRAQRLARVESS
jgi:ComEC/Rec2-related protein